MHGHWIEPPEARTDLRFLAILAAFAICLAAALTPAEAAEPGKSRYRPLILAASEEPAMTGLFPAGVYERRLPGVAKRSLAIRSNWRKMTIPAGPNGHFYVTARVKKKPPSYALVNITFLVDTGASLVALTRKDAEALGFEDRDLEFSGVSQTANGEVRFASVTLPELRVGSFKVKDLPASVVDGDLEISLLGNSFLSRLKSYQVANEELVLRW
ncbi:MAG: TIGR02281 family clan AA aspartic protease [Alphaproteobacteria bacterium]